MKMLNQLACVLAIVLACTSPLYPQHTRKKFEKKLLLKKQHDDVAKKGHVYQTPLWKKIYAGVAAATHSYGTIHITKKYGNHIIAGNPFHWDRNNLAYAAHVDNFFHGVAGYGITRLESSLFRPIIGRRSAAWLGFAAGMYITTLVEYNDGKAPADDPYGGAQKGDFIGGWIGSAVGVIQELYPETQDYITFKISRDYRHKGHSDDKKSLNSLSPNYDLWVVWMSVKGKKVLPGMLKHINVAIGLSTENYRGSAHEQVRKEWKLALDIDLGTLLKLPSEISFPVDFIHIPLPETSMR